MSEMKLLEAIIAGKKLRHTSWEPREYIVRDGDYVVSEKGTKFSPVLILYQHSPNGWQILETIEPSLKETILAKLCKNAVVAHMEWKDGDTIKMKNGIILNSAGTIELDLDALIARYSNDGWYTVSEEKK